MLPPPRIEWKVWKRRILPVSIGRFGEICCAAKCLPLHMRGNAASAIAATAKGGFVRIAVIERSKMLRTCSNVRFGEVAPQHRELA